MADVKERKRVTLHPVKEDGTMDLEINLYPKTLVNGIVDSDGNEVDITTQAELDDAINTINAELEEKTTDIDDIKQNILYVESDILAAKQDIVDIHEELETKASIFELDLSSLMSQEEILSLAQYLAGLDEELEKEFLFSELIPVADYLEYAQIKLQYSLSADNISEIVLNKKYATDGEPQFTYEDLEAGITLKLFNGGLIANRQVNSTVRNIKVSLSAEDNLKLQNYLYDYPLNVWGYDENIECYCPSKLNVSFDDFLDLNPDYTTINIKFSYDNFDCL